MSKAVKILFRLNGSFYQYLIQLNYIKTICKRYDGKVDATVLISEDQSLYLLLSSNQSFATFKEGRWPGNIDKYDCVVDLYWFPKVISFKGKKVRMVNAELYSLIRDWINYSEDIRTKKMCEPGNAFLFTITQYLLVFDRRICSSLDVGNHFGIEDIDEYKVDSEKLCQHYDKEKYGEKPIITVNCHTKNSRVRQLVKEKYELLCGQIKQKMNIAIIQLYVFDDEKLGNVDHLVHDLNETQFLALMEKSVLHIGVEDETIHVRRVLSNKISASLYHTMDSNVWGYKSNINLCLNEGPYVFKVNAPENNTDIIGRGDIDEKFSEYFVNIIDYLEKTINDSLFIR